MQPEVSRLLVIDDDESLLYAIRKSLSHSQLQVELASSGSAGIERLKSSNPDAVLLDLRLNDASGLDILGEIRKFCSDVPVIIFTAYSTPGATIEATQLGAFDYLLKPVDLQLLKGTVGRAIQERILSRTQRLESVAFNVMDQSDVTIIGSSPSMQEVYKKIGRFAGTSSNVLILGESGTGKDLVAQSIHCHSKRKKGPFLAINCAALSETLLESELFGHERGAFTGADKRRIGKFEFAKGGTIFLDEIGDMLPSTQAKILRLLQDQQFERLGGNESIKTDVRIVAATNKDLGALIRLGKFRDDLFYRLNVFSILLPPLRERLSDLKDLFRFFIACYKKDFGKDRIQISPEVDDILSRYDWPGNMRELQSVTKHALAHATGGHIGVEHLPQALLKVGLESGVTDSPTTFVSPALVQSLLLDGTGRVYERCVDLMDQSVLPLALAHTHGNLQQACDLLGMSRNTLKTKLRELPRDSDA